MITKTVGIQELQAEIETYLQLVKTGGEVVITERGEPIGRIVPMRPSLEERRRELMDAGIIQWSGEKLQPRKPGPRIRGKKTMAELVSEGRE